MRLRTAAVALISAAAFTSMSGVAAHASTSTKTACASMTQGVAGLSASQAIHLMAAEMPHACGFTVSGQFDGPGFSIDGWEIYGTSTYGALGAVHVVWLNQGNVLDFYRAGGADYLRIYLYGQPNAANPSIDVTTTWQAFGISSALVKEAGSAKWIKLTAAQEKKIVPDLGVPLTASELASDIAQGSGEPWKLGGTKTVDGVKSTALVDPVNNSGPGYLGESLYVSTATDLPVWINYVTQDHQSVTATFGHWGHSSVTPPPASKVVAG